MRILSEFDIRFDLPARVTMVAMLDLHPSLDPLVRRQDGLVIESGEAAGKETIDPVPYLDAFGNRCSRFTAPPGPLRLAGSNVLEITGEPDPIQVDAQQAEIENLPTGVLQYLLASRYCQLDQMCGIASDLFGATTPGWARAIYIRDWVHHHVRFDYSSARPTKTALDVFTERVGVCRDFQHLAITLSRAMNIPARYVTGYLGDIRVPFGGPGDFSAWYEVFLDGRWWTMDARHNTQRIGRILMATGRDATDVAITTSFGAALLTHFSVESNEIDEDGNKVPLPQPATSAVEAGPGDEALSGSGARQTETATD